MVLPVVTSFGSAATAEITRLGDILDGSAQDVYVSGSTAFISTGTGGLRIYDISTLSSPVKIGEIDDIGFVESVYIDGDYAYVAAGIMGLYILDISDLTEPMVLSSYRDSTRGHASEVIVMGNYAYLADGIEGLEIIDITDKTRQRLRNDYDNYPIDLSALKIVGNYVYASGYYGMKIINVSDGPDLDPHPNVALLGSYSGSGLNYDIDIAGDYVYLTDSEEGLEILNISDPSNITLLGRYNLPFKSLDSVAVSGSYAYVSSKDGFEIIDVSVPFNPTRVGGIDNGRGLGIHIEGNYAFAAEFEKGVGIYNISDPANPTEYSRIDNEALIEDIVISGNTVYTAIGVEGVLEVDFSNPTAPVLGTGFDSTPVHNLVFQGTNLYARSDLSTIILNTELVEVGNYTEVTTGVAIRDSNLYLFQNHGIQIVDVATPSSPSFLGRYNHTQYGGIKGGCADNSLVYAIDPEYGVYILNVSNPTSIKIISIIDFYLADKIEVHGNLAYIISDVNGLAIYDISNPEEPTKLGEYRSVLALPHIGFAIKEDVVFLGVGTGILILDVSAPEEITLIAKYNEDPVKLIRVIGENIIYSTGDDGLELIHVNITPDRIIPGYSTPIFLFTIMGISVLIAFRKFKK